jgi:prepilin-type N-terminal cleavage/methylation domain-containing protein
MIKTGVTMMELVIAIVIVGILSTIGFSQYFAAKENALNKEAFANLKLVFAAERVYRMEQGGVYYPSLVVTESDIALINQNLKLQLSNSPNRNWNYTVKNTGCGWARRTAAGNRQFFLTATDPDGEPDVGVCP